MRISTASTAASPRAPVKERIADFADFLAGIAGADLFSRLRAVESDRRVIEYILSPVMQAVSEAGRER